VTDEDVAAIEELGRHGGLFERLAASIAPEIFGMLEVKKVRLVLWHTAKAAAVAPASIAPEIFGMLEVKKVRGVGCGKFCVRCVPAQ
jgi:DNA replicative helicase MCM subunit Mcm2 (Cdc46/Mcm family)